MVGYCRHPPVGMAIRQRERPEPPIAWYHSDRVNRRLAWAKRAGFDTMSCRGSARPEYLGTALYDQFGGSAPAGRCAPSPEEAS